jgi:ribosomal protein S18 acetylase RimI-like enzyme
MVMKLIEYQNPTEFLQDIFPFLEDNFISHYLLFETTDRLIHREEDVYYCCTVKINLKIEIIYIHTNIGHYFYGNTQTEIAVNRLSEKISSEQFDNESILQGSTFIINNFILDKGLNFKNIRHRFYMSLKTCNFKIKITEGELLMANESDYDSLVSLMRGFYIEEFEGKGIQTEEKICSDFKRGLQEDGTYYLKVKNKITTMISTTRLPGQKIYIPNIYTSPKFRNRGFSKFALGTLLTELLDSGNIEIGLNVKVSNLAAIGLFRSMGMRKIYETGVYEM